MHMHAHYGSSYKDPGQARTLVREAQGVLLQETGCLGHSGPPSPPSSSRRLEMVTPTDYVGNLMEPPPPIRIR